MKNSIFFIFFLLLFFPATHNSKTIRVCKYYAYQITALLLEMFEPQVIARTVTACAMGRILELSSS